MNSANTIFMNTKKEKMPCVSAANNTNVNGKLKQKFWGRLSRTFGPDLLAHRRMLISAYTLSFVAEGLAVLSPWPLKVIIDHVIVSQSLPEPFKTALADFSAHNLAIAMTLIFLFLAIGDALAGAASKITVAKVRERLGVELRDRVLEHIQKLPPSIQTTQRSGELVLRLVGDVNVFAKLQTKTLPEVFRIVVTCALTLLMMFCLELRLALLGLIIAPGLVLLIKHYNAPLNHASRSKRRHEGEVAGLAQEIVRGLPTIQALSNERQVRTQFTQINTRSMRAGIQETRIEVQIARTLQIVQGLAVALITGGGALMVLQGQMTVGTLTLFVTYIKKLLNPVEKINDLATDVARGLAAGEQLLTLLEKPPAVQDASNAIAIDRCRGLIELRHVGFSYADITGQTAPVLRGVNLKLEPGRLTALIGGSGNGKSTILNLLLRLNEPTTGEILLDKRPLRQYTLRSLRNQMAVMLQNTHLFAGTVREALCSQHPNIPDKKLWEALAMVSLDDFVKNLPKRLDAELGEDGLNFSGGQRKRLSLARAFLLDRPILLLDEPLANIDAASATVIMNALERIRVGRTCLVITHESELMNKADVVYHLDGGVIEEMKPVTLADSFAMSQIHEPTYGARKRHDALILPRNGVLV